MTLERTVDYTDTSLTDAYMCRGKTSILVSDFTSILCIWARQRLPDRVSSQNPKKAKKHQPYNFSVRTKF